MVRIVRCEATGGVVKPRGGGGTLGNPKDSVLGRLGVHLREH